MSNELAIAAATLTLQKLLGPAAADISMDPPDKARERSQAGGTHLNLFLYQAVVSAAWRNADVLRQTTARDTGYLPPLALNLHYLITAFGENEAVSHEVLGRAMSILHDHMLLGSQEIALATLGTGANPGPLLKSDLHLQAERLRITPIPLTLEEISKLWSGFQTHYRLSAAYEVAVVLIDSIRPGLTPLPVLRQGEEDRGPYVLPSFPSTLAEVAIPNGFPAAPLGALLTLRGQNLSGDIEVKFRHFRLQEPIEIKPALGGSASERQVKLPTGPPAIVDWPPGFYTVSVVTRLSSALKWSSNEVPFALAPSIKVEPTAAPAGDVDLTVTATPRLRDGQPALLLFGDLQVTPDQVTTPADATRPTTLTFNLKGVEKGEYVVRLRVDGADSVPILRAGTPPLLKFDPDQKVVVT